MNKLASIKNMPQRSGFSSRRRRRRRKKTTVYKFINPGMLGANQPTTQLPLSFSVRLHCCYCGCLLLLLLLLLLGTHLLHPALLSSVHGWMLILGATLQQRRRAVSGTGTGGGTGWRPKWTELVAGATLSSTAAAVVGKFNFLFSPRHHRQHELFNDPRLGAFMQMEGLINTKTVA